MGKGSGDPFETRAEAEQYANETRATLKAGTDPEATRNTFRLGAGMGYATDCLVRVSLAHISS